MTTLPAEATVGTGASATDIAAAISVPGLVSGASFDARPSELATGTSDSALGSLPTLGETFAVMSTGRADVITSANSSGSTGEALGGGNQRGNTDFDVTILKLNLVVPTARNCLSFDFRFYSEEYPEYVGSGFNDAFIAELDSSTWSTSGSSITAENNFAFGPAGEVISINTSGVTSMTPEAASGTTFDGATPALRARTPITPGQHTLWLSIFDQGDAVYDSAVILDNLRTDFVGNCTSGTFVKDDAVPGTFGCSWPVDSSGKATLYWAYGDPHRYRGNVYQGGVNWTNASSRISLSEWPGVPARVHVPVVDAYLPTDAWGFALWATDCPTGSYERITITLNQRTLDPYKDFIRTKVATHEFGHALGLAHETNKSVASVMQQGVIKWNTPQTRDVNLIQELYKS